MSKHIIHIDESKFKIKSRSILGAPEVPTVIKFLVGRKIIKKEKNALFAILLFIILFMSISLFLIKKSVTVPLAIINPSLITNNR